MPALGDAGKGDALKRSLRILGRAASEHDHCAVAFSGGKDSLVVLDLCVRAFKRVTPFFMYLVPGLACVARELAIAEERYGVKVAQYPHWVRSKIADAGVYLPPSSTPAPSWTLDDVYALALQESGATVLATGARLADSPWRRRQMATWGNKSETLYPASHWNKLQVLGYLRMRGIPVPASSGKSATGIDLTEPSLLWLHDTYPDDFERLCRSYPLARGMIKRREYFGDTEHRLGGKRAATAQA
jgi:phosphoadenosine phosphosulfate reductase